MTLQEAFCLIVKNENKVACLMNERGDSERRFIFSDGIGLQTCYLDSWRQGHNLNLGPEDVDAEWEVVDGPWITQSQA